MAFRNNYIIAEKRRTYNNRYLTFILHFCKMKQLKYSAELFEELCAADRVDSFRDSV